MDNLDPKNNRIIETIKKLTGYMNLDCRIELTKPTDDKNFLLVSVYTPEDAKFLIGRNGQNLKALEQVLKLMFMKNTEELSFTLDVNDYRKSRVTYLIDLAKQAVDRVRNTQKAEALLPMTSYERRVVHMELASCPDIMTESIGEDPYRRVVIKPLTI